jgi:nucleotide-binding universal stress UspA family protein
MPAMFTNILLPTDGSPLSGMAVDAGIALARLTGAHVIALAVVEAGQDRSAAGRVLQAIAARTEAAGLTCSAMLREAEQPHEAIVALAEAEGCDLIVMASRGRGSLSALVLGSVTARVLSGTAVPVLVYR